MGHLVLEYRILVRLEVRCHHSRGLVLSWKSKELDFSWSWEGGSEDLSVISSRRVEVVSWGMYL